MATTITWVVERMDCYPQLNTMTDVVCIVYWRCNGVDGQYVGIVYSSCNVPVPSGSDFTPYADLTEAQVLGWVWTNGVDKDATEAAVAQQIQNQITPPIVAPPLPWTPV